MDKEEREEARKFIVIAKGSSVSNLIKPYRDRLEKALDEIDRLGKEFDLHSYVKETFGGTITEDHPNMFNTMTTTTTEYKEPKLCPVCEGEGDHGLETRYRKTEKGGCVKEAGLKKCHGCDGKGWVAV